MTAAGWQERTSAGRMMVEVRTDAGRRYAASDAGAITLDSADHKAVFFGRGFVDGDGEAGIRTLGTDGATTRLTTDPRLNLGVPADRPWPTLWASATGGTWWLAEDSLGGGKSTYWLMRFHGGRAERVRQFARVDNAAISPGGRMLGLAAADAAKAPGSLFVVDLGTGSVTERAKRVGVVWVTFSDDASGYLTVKPSRRYDAPADANAALDAEVLSPGKVSRWSAAGVEDVMASFAGQQPEELVSSPSGDLAVVAWSRGSGRHRWLSHLWLLRPGSSAVNLSAGQPEAGGAAFSADGGQLAYGAGTTAFVYSVNEAKKRQLNPAGTDAWWEGAGSFVWTPAGLLYFSNADSSGRAARLSLWLHAPDRDTRVEERPAAWRA